MDSTQALKYIELWWTIMGVYPVVKYKIHQVFHLFLTTIVPTCFACATFTSALFFIADTKGLLRNLPMNIVLYSSAVKLYIIFLIRLRLLEANDLIRKLDQRVTTPSQVNFLRKVAKFSQIMTLVVTVCYMSVDITAAINALLSHRTKLLFETWLPYDWKTSAWKYYLSIALQSYTQVILCFQTASNDVGPIIYLIILTSHFRILMKRLEHIKKDPLKSDDESMQELLKCIEDHRTMMAIFNSLQRTISHTIFIQFVATALILAMTLLTFILYRPDVTESTNIIIFVVAIILQIFPSCYYANKFMAMTSQLVTSLYSMDWYNHSQKFKKTLIIFMSMTQKEQVIFAGRIIPINLATFVSVMKVSYSMITVAQQLVHKN